MLPRLAADQITAASIEHKIRSIISLTIYQLFGLAAAAPLDRGTGKIDAGVDPGEIVRH